MYDEYDNPALWHKKGLHLENDQILRLRKNHLTQIKP